LQGLLLPARFLSGDVLLRADNVATVLLASVPLRADLFDGTTHAGPVPLLFASKKEEALECISKHPETMHEGTEGWNFCFSLSKTKTVQQKFFFYIFTQQEA
jgi:hypothetical protein